MGVDYRLRLVINLLVQLKEGADRDLLAANFPKVQRQQAQLKEIEGMMDTEKRNILEALGNDYNAARQREGLLNEALNEQKIEVNQMAQSMVEYNILKRDAEGYKTMYDGLLRKLKEALVPKLFYSFSPTPTLLIIITPSHNYLMRN